VSFVLEALKKQEAGHDPDAAVSLARQAVERRRSRLWVTLFGIAVAVNAGLLGWMFGMPWLSSADPPAPTIAESGPSSTATPVPAQGAEPTASSQPTDPPSGVPATPGEAATSPPATPQPEAVPEAATRPAPRIRDVTLQNLPADPRSRFPGIAFSTHIYAEDTDLRAIVANGQRLQEGDRIRGLEIVAITEDGVVLAFENYRVAVPIVTDW
jgi:hypothetical protein